MQDIIMTILECIATVIVIVVARYAIPAINTKVAGTKYEALVAYIEKVVYAMQQTLVDNEEKKAEAVTKVTDYLDNQGLKVSEDEINVLIEAAVKQMKIEENK